MLTIQPERKKTAICGKKDSIVRLSIPIHGNKPLKVGLLGHLMKLASLREDDLR